MTSGMRSRAYWVVRPGAGEIREALLPVPDAGSVLVRTLCSGISRGTESLVFQGRVPASQYATMRCPFQDGNFPAPVKYGYGSVGRVESGPRSWWGNESSVCIRIRIFTWCRSTQ